MARLGIRNTLTAVRESQPGIYLDGGALGEILLPGKFIPRTLRIRDTIEVFVYRDSEDRLVATTETPLACVGEFACMRVKDIHERAGAFLDWGLSKDLLLPYREQRPHVQVGEKVVVKVLHDTETDRVIATALITQHFSRTKPEYAVDQEVDLLVFETSELGCSVIVEHAHRGLIYNSSLASPLEVGTHVRGFVQEVREDGKIDLRLDRSGYERVAPLTEQILEALAKAGGRLNFDDSSSPDAIRARFHTSKKAFKQALGALFKARKITFLSPGIELTKQA
ncbi:MAG: GntR family transcriptional regulator [Phycisphaerales bacterium]|nr:GntR family transcriptional regulator [Phycisphaerales bacterium]